MATKHSSPSPQIPFRIKGHTKCPYHKDNEVVLLCQDCGLLICTTCSITSHKPHIDSFQEISKITNERKNTLLDFMNETENIEIPKLKNEIQSARKAISTSESNYKKLSVNIKKQPDQCKHITNLEDRLNTLVKLSSECKQTLQTGTAVLVYDSVSEIQDILYKLCDSPTVISQFSYPDPITSICPTSDGRAWLCYCNTNRVNLINNKGQVIQKIQHNSNLQHISLDPTTGRLWFCCWDERTIYKLSTSSTPVTRFTTEGYPHSLCVTREGLVVVGTYGTQGYKVVMYTADGQVLHTATVEGSGTGYVPSITQCGVTGNIAIVSSKLISGDRSDYNNYRNHIIVYNPTLQSLVHYRGEGIQAREAVTPVTVVYDSKGNIVISDWTRNTIELISGAGKYIKTLHTNKGQQGTVGIQKDDVLWSRLESDTGEWGLKLLKYYSD